MNNRSVIAFTPGDPAGVGPDLAVALAESPPNCDIVIIGDRKVLNSRARQIDSNVLFSDGASMPGSSVHVSSIECAATPVAGTPNSLNAQYVLKTLDAAVQGCLSGRFDAMVTGPVNKAVISEAGFDFSGHTEYLAQQTDSPCPVMMLASNRMRVALTTTHIRLSQVSAAITRERLRSVLSVLNDDLQCRFRIKSPRIAVCGLNPHAGEAGLLGSEELQTIAPVIEELQGDGLDIVGPIPADTAFTQSRLAKCDVVLAMYHDQGLPVIKHDGFGDIANITLGLPIIRTSVDHGTAYDIAGTGRVDPGSMMTAIDAALNLCRAKDDEPQ